MSARALIGCSVACASLFAAQEIPTKRLQPASPHATAGVTYRDVTNLAGLSSFKHVSGTPEKNYIIEATGSGVALWDFDNDGLVDIYLVNGSTIDRLQRGFPGQLGLAATNLSTGEEVLVNADEVFPTASVIKVSILAELFG